MKFPPVHAWEATVRSWVPTRRNLTSDLAAGLTFAIVNVPQAMAHAVLATVNPVLGIYTLMVAAPVGALLTGSVFMNISTTAALSVATGATLVVVPPGERVEALVVLVLLVGALQFAAGLFRLGFLLRFVSNAVMVGFLNGIAVLIILGQLGDLTGHASAFTNRIAQTVDLVLHPAAVSLPTFTIGGATLALMVGLLLTPFRRYAFILAIVAATALLALLKASFLPTAPYFATVATVGEIALIPRLLPEIVLPQPALVASQVLPAVAVAIIGVLQGAGVSQSTPNPDGRYPDVSRDFLGQGIANIATSLVAGLPAGGSISGTALVQGAGARSRWSNVFVGVFVATIVLFAAGLVERVPMPALAALLIVAGWQGLRLAEALLAWRTGPITAAVMMLTFVATLAVPLQFAVLFGVGLSLLLHVFRQSNKVVVTEWVLQPTGLPLEQPAPRTLAGHRLTILNVYGSLFFAAARSLEEILPEFGDAQRAAVALVLRGKSEIGSTFVLVLQRYAEALRERDGRLMLVGVDPAVRDQLDKTGVLAVIGEDNVFVATPQLGAALESAVLAAHSWLGQK